MLVLKLLKLAARVAMPTDPEGDMRNFLIGAIGIRGDGVLVSARNGSVRVSETIGGGWSFPPAHAEARCSKKMDHDGIVYVSRVYRGSGKLGCARPCPDCVKAMLARRVKKCYYTISDTEYGVINLRDTEERVIKKP